MRGMPKAVKGALQKARDSALLAVEVYNKPAITFKSGGYITLMIIAWTSLFHAIFFRKKLKPFQRKNNGRFERVDGDYKYWELQQCLNEYYKADTGNAVKKNLEFFVPLRNRIEHRSMPELDSNIFGECQAMLLNFDEMLDKEFGKKYCIRESLSFSLQLFPSSQSLADAVKSNPSGEPIANFIQQYRSSISSDVAASGKYSFKAFLIQVTNHPAEDTLPIQFVNYDKLLDEQKNQLSQFVVAVKAKQVPVSNLNLMKPSAVVQKVQAILGNPKVMRGMKAVNKFNENIHAKCWKKYKIRPNSTSLYPAQTESKYCVWDAAHKDYLYTQAWVDFLVKKLGDSREFDSLYTTLPLPSGSGSV